MVYFHMEKVDKLLKTASFLVNVFLYSHITVVSCFLAAQ